MVLVPWTCVAFTSHASPADGVTVLMDPARVISGARSADPSTVVEPEVAADESLLASMPPVAGELSTTATTAAAAATPTPAPMPNRPAIPIRRRR